MKILIVGASGTIGRRLTEYLTKDHKVITASRSNLKYSVDITDEKSISSLLIKTGKLDAIICVAGEAKWKEFSEMSEQDYYIGIRSKLMGQVNLVRIGLEHLKPGGCITLTTGILGDHPVPMTTSAAMVNGAIHSFVKALNQENLNDKRVNVIAAPLVEDSVKKYEQFFKGQPVIAMNSLAAAYEKSLLSSDSGKIYRLY